LFVLLVLVCLLFYLIQLTMSVVDALHSQFGLQAWTSPHITIGVTAIFVFALVASAALLSLQKGKLDFNKGLLSYVKFAWSCFLKPHERESDGETGQQHALESFYRAQV
jgi:betaine lipid synthase